MLVLSTANQHLQYQDENKRNTFRVFPRIYLRGQRVATMKHVRTRSHHNREKPFLTKTKLRDLLLDRLFFAFGKLRNSERAFRRPSGAGETWMPIRAFEPSHGAKVTKKREETENVGWVVTDSLKGSQADGASNGALVDARAQQQRRPKPHYS